MKQAEKKTTPPREYWMIESLHSGMVDTTLLYTKEDVLAFRREMQYLSRHYYISHFHEGATS